MRNPEGTAMYKGRRIHISQLHASMQHNNSTVSPLPQFCRLSTTPAAGRLRVMTFKIGGLSTAACDEFQCWVHQKGSHHRWDLIFVQETQWQQDREFTGPCYHVVHSAGQDRNSGVMIVVAKWCCSEQHIRQCAMLPGRLLHVRLHTPGAAVDAICIYQHHSLASVGVQAAGATKLMVHTTRQLQALAKAPAHATHESNHKLLSRLGIPF